MKSIGRIIKIRCCKSIILALLFLGVGNLSAQNIYKLGGGKEIEVQVSGTSNVHDWTMTSTVADSQGTFKINGKEEITDLSSLAFSIPAKSLKSGKSLMDSRTYKSLKADEFPTISYQLKAVEIAMVQSNKFRIHTKGSVTIAGKTQPITMVVNSVVNTDKSITCSGTTLLKLTDFGIDPPSFMLGAMKVGNELTVKFDLTYNKILPAK